MAELVGYCTICGKQFIKYRPFHEVCSDRCRRIKTERNHYGYELKEDVTKKCKNCGKEFTDNNKKKIYCCNECAVTYNKGHRIKKEIRIQLCPVCYTTFKTTHPTKTYCCNECYREAKKERDSVQRM